jgi:hypothetical protein
MGSPDFAYHRGRKQWNNASSKRALCSAHTPPLVSTGGGSVSNWLCREDAMIGLVNYAKDARSVELREWPIPEIGDEDVLNSAASAAPPTVPCVTTFTGL